MSYGVFKAHPIWVSPTSKHAFFQSPFLQMTRKASINVQSSFDFERRVIPFQPLLVAHESADVS